MLPASTIHHHRSRITRVLDYLLTHSSEDPSLETLAGVAHYSPFHLQKLFKEHVGETPKQYALHLRLETAFHYLLIDPHRSIGEIAMDTGFSSISVFSRAMKNQFGHSPAGLRKLPHARQMHLLHGKNEKAKTPQPQPKKAQPQPGKAHPEEKQPVQIPPDITIIRQQKIPGTYLLAPFNDPKKIHEAFRSLASLSAALGLPGDRPYGILTPHQRNTYRVFLPAPEMAIAGYPQYEIPAGTFAVFTVSGDLRATNKIAHYFYRRWLPANGYKIAGIAGFETFTTDPAITPYDRLQRRIHIPIEPRP